MITITHYKSGSVGVHCRPGEALYALGIKPAHYPVPAIRYELIVEPWPKFFGCGAVLFVKEGCNEWVRSMDVLYVDEEGPDGLRT